MGSAKMRVEVKIIPIYNLGILYYLAPSTHLINVTQLHETTHSLKATGISRITFENSVSLQLFFKLPSWYTVKPTNLKISFLTQFLTSGLALVHHLIER